MGQTTIVKLSNCNNSYNLTSSPLSPNRQIIADIDRQIYTLSFKIGTSQNLKQYGALSETGKLPFWRLIS